MDLPPPSYADSEKTSCDKSPQKGVSAGPKHLLKTQPDPRISNPEVPASSMETKHLENGSTDREKSESSETEVAPFSRDRTLDGISGSIDIASLIKGSTGIDEPGSSATKVTRDTISGTSGSINASNAGGHLNTGIKGGQGGSAMLAKGGKTGNITSPKAESASTGIS